MGTLKRVPKKVKLSAWKPKPFEPLHGSEQIPIAHGLYFSSDKGFSIRWYIVVHDSLLHLIDLGSLNTDWITDCMGNITIRLRAFLTLKCCQSHDTVLTTIVPVLNKILWIQCESCLLCCSIQFPRSRFDCDFLRWPLDDNQKGYLCLFH